MRQNVGELVTGSPVSWWTCGLRRPATRPTHSFSYPFFSSCPFSSSSRSSRPVLPEDLRQLYLQFFGSSDTSFPFLRGYRRAWATDCNGISRIHTCSPVIPHVRAPARCVWAWISPRRKRYVGPRWYLLLIHFDSRVKGACTSFHRNFEGSSNKDLKDVPLVSLKFLTVRFVSISFNVG